MNQKEFFKNIVELVRRVVREELDRSRNSKIINAESRSTKSVISDTITNKPLVNNGGVLGLLAETIKGSIEEDESSSDSLNEMQVMALAKQSKKLKGDM